MQARKRYRQLVRNHTFKSLVAGRSVQQGETRKEGVNNETLYTKECELVETNEARLNTFAATEKVDVAQKK